MDALKRVPMCDINTFVAALFPEKNKDKMKRYSDGDNCGTKILKSKRRKYFHDDYLKEENSSSGDEEYSVSEDEENSSSEDEENSASEDEDAKSDKPKRRRKYFQDDENSVSENEENSASEGKSYKPKTGVDFYDDDSNDKDYNPRKHKEPKEIHKTWKRKAPLHHNLTEYEMMVQKNREEQMAFLESLKFNEIKESLSESLKNVRAKPTPKSHKTVKRTQRRSIVMPERKSLRLANVDVDLSEEAIASRVKSETIETIQKKLPAVLSFSKALQDDLYEDFATDFRDLDHGNTKPFDDYVSYFHDMQLPESQIAKVVPGRITSLAFHPMREKIVVAAASKYGNIGFWNVNSDSNPYVFEPHVEGITFLKFNPDHPQLIVSSSYDGTLRCGDLENSVFNEVYNVSEETCCTHFDFLSPNTFLVAQKNGNVSVVDNRIRINTSGKKHKCHNNPVKSVSVHPLDKSYFISAENKGIIRLWDLRKLQKQPVVEVQHHKRCVQSAFFSPLTGKSVLTTSSDDTICLFDSSNLGKSLLFKHSMKHNNQTGRWLTTFRATWLPNTDDAFVVGSMLFPRRIEIYNDKMNNIFNFTHENLGCITSVNIFHPSLPVLAGSNSSGKVYVFSDGGA